MSDKSKRPLLRYEVDRIEREMKEGAKEHGIDTDDAFFILGCSEHGPTTCVLTYAEGAMTYTCHECNRVIISVKVAETDRLFFEPKAVS